jgi:hypothetical protein
MKIQAIGLKPIISRNIKKDSNGAANNIVKLARKENLTRAQYGGQDGDTTGQYGGQDGDTTGKKSPKIGIGDKFGSSFAVNY